MAHTNEKTQWRITVLEPELDGVFPGLDHEQSDELGDYLETALVQCFYNNIKQQNRRDIIQERGHSL